MNSENKKAQGTGSPRFLCNRFSGSDAAAFRIHQAADIAEGKREVLALAVDKGETNTRHASDPGWFDLAGDR